MTNLGADTAVPRKIRQRSEVAALRALHLAGRLSRADLARVLGLNRSSSGHIIASLTAGGLVREARDDRAEQSAPPKAGRPGILLELVPEAVCFLGVEIGVEHIAAVEIDLAAKIVWARSEPFDGAAGTAEAAVRRAVQLACQDIPATRLRRCEGFGVSAPAQMGRNGSVRVAPLLGWRDIDLAGLARQALPVAVPVLAENDANALAFGATYGPTRRHAGVTLFLAMESGVGGGIIIDGSLFRGGHGLAGEVGHLIVGDPSSPRQNFEQRAGLDWLISAYRRATARADPPLVDLLADVESQVPEAVSIAEQWAETLAFGLVQACRIIDPDRIVLSGSVAALYPLVAGRVAAHIGAIQEPGFPVPPIVMSDGGPAGSAFGAACMLHQRYLSLDSQGFGGEPMGPSLRSGRANIHGEQIDASENA